MRVIASETLSVWCSLSEKLGMWAIKSELEDLCFAVLEPENYDAIIAARDDAWRPAEPAQETTDAVSRCGFLHVRRVERGRRVEDDDDDRGQGCVLRRRFSGDHVRAMASRR